MSSWGAGRGASGLNASSEDGSDTVRYRRTARTMATRFSAGTAKTMTAQDLGLYRRRDVLNVDSGRPAGDRQYVHRQ
jgi:hypothetical protein